jgi:hypothetical protein
MQRHALAALVPDEQHGCERCVGWYHRHWRIPGLTVLTVTTNAIHLEQMLRYLRSLNEPQLASRFLFKSKPHFGANWEVPPIMPDLFGEPWTAGDETQVAIDRP